MVWGAIKVGEKPVLMCVEENIDSDIYKTKILMPFFKELKKRDPNFMEKDWIFQQDGARCHTSHKSL